VQENQNNQNNLHNCHEKGKPQGMVDSPFKVFEIDAHQDTTMMNGKAKFTRMFTEKHSIENSVSVPNVDILPI
jgi:hypothetical protein